MRNKKNLTIFSVMLLVLLPAVFAGSWSGNVYDTAGTAVDQADVALLLNSATENSSQTDASGFFEVSGLQDGYYTIAVTKTGYYDASLVTGIYLNNSDASKTNLSLIPGIMDIIMVEQLPGNLAGTVTDPNGNVTDATINLTQPSGTIASGNSDATGNYDISVIEGTYTVTISAPGRITQTRNNVVIAPNATTTLNIYLSLQPGDVQGTVRDAINNNIIENSTVVIEGTSHVAFTDATGQYLITNVPQGTYICTASAAGYYDSSVGCTILPSGIITVDFYLTPTNINDTDGDGIEDSLDNCPLTSNPGQGDSDNDGVGNVCDNCKSNSNSNQKDTDNDGVGNVCDNCPSHSNSNQYDSDGDGQGEVCDTTNRRRGGGGGNSGGSFVVTKTLDFSSTNPVCDEYSRYEQISFNFNNKAYTLNFEKVKIAPMYLSKSEVTMMFSGASKESFSVKYNQRQYLDLNGDGINDIKVSFDKVNAIKNKVYLCFELLPQDVTSVVTKKDDTPIDKPAAEKVKEDVKEIVEKVKEGILNIFGEVTEKKPASALVGALIILAIVLPGILLYLFLFRKRRY
jgi:hypothetical protein